MRVPPGVTIIRGSEKKGEEEKRVGVSETTWSYVGRKDVSRQLLDAVWTGMIQDGERISTKKNNTTISLFPSSS